jgi:hypothetical protein
VSKFKGRLNKQLLISLTQSYHFTFTQHGQEKKNPSLCTYSVFDL